MTTPLWSEAELTANIEALKLALLNAGLGKEVEYNDGRVNKKFTAQDLPEIKSLLDYYQGERTAIENGLSGSSGYSTVGGITRRVY